MLAFLETTTYNEKGNKILSDNQPESAIRDYALSGKVLQLATNDKNGLPWVCHVWYAVTFEPDRIYFTSNIVRNHSQHIEQNPNVAAGILAATPDQLGDRVRGLSVQGTARIVPSSDLDKALEVFVNRWPAAAGTLTAEAIRSEEIPNRLYEIVVQEWILHDEVNFPGDPRQELVGR